MLHFRILYVLIFFPWFGTPKVVTSQNLMLFERIYTRWIEKVRFRNCILMHRKIRTKRI